MAEVIQFPGPVLAHELLEVYVWQDTSQDSYLKIGESRQVILVGGPKLRRTFNWKVAIDRLREEWKEVAYLDEEKDPNSAIFLLLFLDLLIKFFFIDIGDYESQEIAEWKKDPNDDHIDKLRLQVQLILYISDCVEQVYQNHCLNPVYKEEEADIEFGH